MKQLLIVISFFTFLLGCADLFVREFSLDLDELPKSLSINKKDFQQNPSQKVCLNHTISFKEKSKLKEHLKKVNNNEDLSYIDTSEMTDMSELFYEDTSFNGDVSCWDVSKVKNMKKMFNHAWAFNQDISGWNVSKVTNMQDMFNGAKAFNQDISGWNVSSVTDMSYMFNGAKAFNNDDKPSELNKWSINTNKTNIRDMFISSLIESSGNYPKWCTVDNGCR